MSKLNPRDRAQLVVIAYETGLVAAAGVDASFIHPTPGSLQSRYLEARWRLSAQGR